MWYYKYIIYHGGCGFNAFAENDAFPDVTVAVKHNLWSSAASRNLTVATFDVGKTRLFVAFYFIIYHLCVSLHNVNNSNNNNNNNISNSNATYVYYILLLENHSGGAAAKMFISKEKPPTGRRSTRMFGILSVYNTPL